MSRSKIILPIFRGPKHCSTIFFLDFLFCNCSLKEKESNTKNLFFFKDYVIFFGNKVFASIICSAPSASPKLGDFTVLNS